MDDILYYILFTVGSIVMFGLNNWAEKKRKQGNGTPPPVNKRNIGNLPSSDDDNDDDDDDDKPGSKDPTEVTWSELFELIKEVRTPTPPKPQRQPRQAASSAPPVHRQVVQQPTPEPKQSYVIESPEMEGQSVTNAKQSTTTDHVYDMPSADLSSEIRSTDWRRAMIAHEILKRKF